MSKKKSVRKKNVVQELDMTEHAARLRSLQPTPWESIKKSAVWLAALLLLFALIWLALAR